MLIYQLLGFGIVVVIAIIIGVVRDKKIKENLKGKTIKMDFQPPPKSLYSPQITKSQICFCPECGKEIPQQSKFCINCRASIPSQTMTQIVEVSNRNTTPTVLVQNEVCCPKCNSNQLQAVVENDTHSSGRDFSAGKGCLGFLIFGPLGLLCGACGRGRRTHTTSRHFWICQKCGHKFINAEVAKTEDQQRLRDFSIIALAVGVGSLVGWVSELIDHTQFLGIPRWVYLVVGVVGIIVGICGFVASKDENL